MANGDWNHSKVFNLLADRGNRQKDKGLAPPYYVTLYPQRFNAALLYDETVAAPVHINESRVQPEFWAKLEPALEYVSTDNKGPDKEAQNFLHYRVKDWDALARALGLTQ